MSEAKTYNLDPTDRSMTFVAQDFPAPGTWVELFVTPRFKGETQAQIDGRINDAKPRRFKVQASLGKGPLYVHNAKTDLTPDDGESYLTLSDEMSHAIAHLARGKLRFDVNNRQEISLISTEVDGYSIRGAIATFNDALVHLLDRASYVSGVPVFITRISAHDLSNHVKGVVFISPPRPVVMDRHGEKLAYEMKPIYALYREATNSSSPYYKLLCLYKIMEGLLTGLRKFLRKKAESMGIILNKKNAIVPNHNNFPKDLSEHIGKPIKEFFDIYLKKEHRNAVSHFMLNDGSILDVGVIKDTIHFVSVSFVADLCVRILIGIHEDHLLQILEAETQSQ